MAKTEKELYKDFNNTKLGKKFLKPVKIFTILLIIALIPSVYTVIDEAFEINFIDKDISTIINGIFDILLFISLIFDARYYGAFAQYKVDKE